MAGDEPKHDPMKDVYFVVGLVVVLVVLWYWSGASKNANLSGIFLPSPLESSTSTSEEPQFQTGQVAPPPTVQY